MIGGEKSWRAEAVARLAHIGGPGESIVARMEHVGAETVTGAQFGVGREACDKHISDHASDVTKDIAEAKRRYAPDAPWSAESLGLFTQAVIQGAFIMAKAKHSPEVAAESLGHLRRYLETQFTPTKTQASR